jgi:hypothetical protein
MESLIKITLDELQRDGITADKMEEMKTEDRKNLILAYAQSAIKRFDKFSAIYQTNPEAKATFQKMILSIA